MNSETETKAIDKYVKSMIDFDNTQNQQYGYGRLEDQLQENIDKRDNYFKTSAIDLSYAVKNRHFDTLTRRLKHYNKITLRLFSDLTGVKYGSLNTDKNIQKAIRSIDPVKYDEWINEKKEAKEQELAENQKSKDDERKSKIENMNGYGEDLSPMQLTNTENLLKKTYNFDGKIMSTQDKIDELILKGKAKLQIIQENKVKEWSRRRYNRATWSEQEEHDRKVKEGGEIDVYYVGGYKFPKLVYNYAEYLERNLNKKEKTNE